MKAFYTKDGKNIVNRLSRWITIKHAYNVNRRNSLFDFSTDENGYKPGQDEYNPGNGTFLDYFCFNGRKYAIEHIDKNIAVITALPLRGCEPFSRSGEEYRECKGCHLTGALVNLDIFNTSLKEALDTGFIQNRAYDEQVFDRNVLYSSNKIYGTDMEVNSFGKDKPLTIIGHTPLKEVTYYDDLNILCIDTAGFLKDGRISVVDMGTFKCYDSDKKEFDLNLIEPSLS